MPKPSGALYPVLRPGPAPWTLTYSRLRGPKAQGGCGGVESRRSEGSGPQRSPQLGLGVPKQGRLSCPQSCDRRGHCHLLQHWDKFTGTQRSHSLLHCREHSVPMGAAGTRAPEYRGSHQSHQCCPVSLRPLGTVLQSSPWSCPEPSSTCPAFPNSATGNTQCTSSAAWALKLPRNELGNCLPVPNPVPSPVPRVPVAGLFPNKLFPAVLAPKPSTTQRAAHQG